MTTIDVRPAGPEDTAYVRRTLTELMAGTSVAGHGELIDVVPLPGLVAWAGDEPVGHLAYRSDADGGWEIVSIVATRPGTGAGGALLDHALALAGQAGVARVWLVTTNDNTHALRFYQRHGFDLVRLHRDAVTRSREKLKPAIPTHVDGIPVRHELELEWRR